MRNIRAQQLTWGTKHRPSAKDQGLSVSRRLNAVELGVLPALGHELVVRADLDHAGAVEDDDEVGHAHGGEAVRHEDR